ncbi:MAG: hypothetical protein ABL903_11150 [Methylococcales bacterium]
MYKVFLSSFMLLSAASYADNTPTFDFTTGILSMPFVSTSQGNYTATLQIDPNLPATSFTISQVGATAVASDTTNPPSFDFNSGVLKLPTVNTSNGTYTATLQLNGNIFKLTAVNSATPPSSSGSPVIAGCPIFPANNYWNTRIDSLPLHPRSGAWINTIRTAGIRTDFGADYGSGPFGQPYNIAAASQAPKYNFVADVPSESDQVGFPIPSNFVLENTEFPRLFTIDTEACRLYEAFYARYENNAFHAESVATWDLRSNALRPDGKRSADKGGFPTVPGLVRYDEVASGTINHALRFTFTKPNTRIWPARHVVGAEVPVNDTLPMGARLRLRGSFDINNFAPELKVILQAMKTYGIVLADDGSALYLSGTPDERWNNDILAALRNVKGSDFEAVNSECMQVNPDSGEANPNQC